MKQYNVGDTVWVARYRQAAEILVPCPVCYGNCKVELILGNGDSVILPCGYCGHGYEAPTGRVKEFGLVSEPEQLTITRISVVSSSKGEETEYLSSHWVLYPRDIFDTKEDALARCQEKIAARLEEENTRTKYLKAKAEKSFAWNAGYHMRAAKKHETDAEYHRGKAILCKARDKKEKQNAGV